MVFHDPAYPQSYAQSALNALLPCEFQITDAAHLAMNLEENCQLLVSFHGPYFPKEAWRDIVHFLKQGGSIAFFGGMPFTRPVREDGSIEPEQDAYSKQVYLGPFFQIVGAPFVGAPFISPPDEGETYRFVPGRAALFLNDCPLSFSASGTFWSCYPKLSQVSDRLTERGSSGPLDTVLTPLLHVKSTTDTLATPAFLLDQRRGDFRGGRWLISAWQPGSEKEWLENAEAIRRMISLTLDGLQTIDVRPALACYHPGEAPVLIVTGSVQQPYMLQIIVSDIHGEVVSTSTLPFVPSSVLHEERIVLPALSEAGLYRVEMQYQSQGGQKMRQESGFWIWDVALVEQVRTQRLTAGRDYFYQADQIFPLFGTTYMDSQVQRQFLFLPNPALWERDFAEMRAAGMNVVRTGVWTGWNEMMPVAGVISEAVLRALDAFVMTACVHAMQVIFTFFAFYPPLFDGKNPWHDPRALQAQEEFVSIIARRYAQVELISWDLINEPSLGDPASAFAKRPLPHDDPRELVVFQEWLKERYTLSELQLRWRQTPADFSEWSQVTLPKEKDYQTAVSANETLHKLKVADYTHFTQEAFKRWAHQMYATIRATGSETLVGVGQDEAGVRIAPQFYASVVDYTTTHPWWNTDDLLWDMLLDKTLSTPNLIQETGVMLVRDVDGRPWRSEVENAYLLERKLITGLAARGAGLIQWLWHTNGYMISDNENSIGLVRPDGSAKPEMAVMREFGRLMGALSGKRVEAMPDVWVVIPYSQWFVHPELAIEGTRQAVRVLGYDLGIVPQLVGEYQLGELMAAKERPETLIVPGLQLFNAEAWQHVRQFVAEGGTVLVSGILGSDSHNLPFDVGVAGLLDEQDRSLPVSRYEGIEDEDGIPMVPFGREKIGYVRKAHNQVRTCHYGKGTLIWSGLPVELADTAEAVRAVYCRTLKLHKEVQRETLVVKHPLTDGSLVLVVSESSSHQCIMLDGGQEIEVAPNRAGAVILSKSGTMSMFGGVRLFRRPPAVNDQH